jgi:PhoH-like ATPase
MKKTIILDTNVYLTEAGSILAFGKNNIAIPTIVLDEIDKHKHRQDTAGLNARTMNRVLDALRSKGSLMDGVPLGRGKGKVFAAHFDDAFMPPGMSEDDSDNKIIAVALRLKDKGHEIAVVSRDLNMRVKCDAHGIECEDYQPQKVISSVENLFTGTQELEVDFSLIDRFYSGEPFLLEEQKVKLFPNQFLLLKNEATNKSAICRFEGYNNPLKKVNKFKNIWGLSARNKEQQYAMDLLFDKDIHVISLTGPAGTGKTLLATACALEQVMNTTSAKGGYDKLIITRPVQPMGRDIGFLPGTLEEKMLPWIAPIRDNLEHLFGDRTALDMQVEQGTIEIEAMTYIRGRSIANAFMIVDEAQNLTAHELKTIITRVGHGTKLVLTGDIQQIDNSYVDSVSNGLTHAVEKFKEHDIAGHITLTKGERSDLATLASEIL